MVYPKADETQLSFQRDSDILMIMDGHAMVRRAYHGISARRNLSTSSGEATAAVFGFCNTFLRAIEQIKPSHCVMTFDLPGPTFRHEIFTDYKGHRPPTPPDLVPQFERVRQLMTSFDVPIMEMAGYEADDLIGTLAAKAENGGIQTVILTGDTDTLQLVSPSVRVLLYHSVQQQQVYDEDAVKLRFGGLTPAQQPDFKAIKGDPSDNVPGVPGLGEKAAIRLLLEYGSLEGIYDRIDEITPLRAQVSLIDNYQQAFQSKELVTIKRDVPVDLDMRLSRFWTFHRSNVVEFVRNLEFNSVVPRIPDGVVSQGSSGVLDNAKHMDLESEQDYQVVSSTEALEAMIKILRQSKGFVFDTETNGLDPMTATLVGLSFSVVQSKAWYVPVGHQEGSQMPMKSVLDALRPILEDPMVSKTGHNLNFDLSVLGSHEISVKGCFRDTMVAAHLLGKKAIGLKGLALDVLQREMVPITDLIGRGKNQRTMDAVSIGKVSPYACADADFTGRLFTIFEKDLRERGSWDLFTTVEMPLIEILVTMQRNGITVNSLVLHDMSENLDHTIGDLQLAVFRDVGHAFNVGSPKQLGGVLFDELGLPKTKKTKTGYSTDANSLEVLRGAHPIIEKILEYRQLTKIKSTYVDALPHLVNKRTGRIHTSYNQAGSATGRISSNDPNLQNIPVRTELGRQVRRAFVAPQADGRNWQLLSADYSQVELRVLAHLSKDVALLEAFQNGEDIHSATASMMFDLPILEVTADQRRIAKILNFGVIYGLSAFGISQQTEFSPDEGRRFIETYFTQYPGIRSYIDDVKQSVRTKGYVETILGRRRYVPEVSSDNHVVRQAGERMAINMPIQGTAADILKLAMIRIHHRMVNSGLEARMLLQVHDELVFEVPEDEIPILSSIVFDEMPNALSGFKEMDVPLDVDIKTGPTWGDMN